MIFEPNLNNQPSKEIVYDLDWINDDTILTVGKKSELCLYKLSVNGFESGILPASQRVYGNPQKDYRCVEVLNPMSKAIVASMDRKITIFDTMSATVVYAADYRGCHNIKCLKWSSDQAVCIIGGENTIGAVDPRQQKASFLVNFNEHRCVRSLSIQGHRITFSTASGKIGFVDLRMPRLLPIVPNSSSLLAPSSTPSNSLIPLFSSSTSLNPWMVKNSDYFQVIGGHLLQNEFYRANFAPHRVEQAIFTHAYDPTGLRLFAAGGPSLESLQGTTAGILF